MCVVWSGIVDVCGATRDCTEELMNMRTNQVTLNWWGIIDVCGVWSGIVEVCGHMRLY
jgi:hypothetical protein